LPGRYLVSRLGVLSFMDRDGARPNAMWVTDCWTWMMNGFCNCSRTWWAAHWP